MKSFVYIRAHNLHEAIGELGLYGENACLLAGGTDLLIKWRTPSGKMPDVVVDISALPELKGIRRSGESIQLQPLVTHTELLTSSIVRERAPLLSYAAGLIGSPQVRNRGTVGGNIMNAAACADTVPPLVALDAEVTLQSNDGTRCMPLADLFLKPYQTKARSDEILASICFAPLPQGSKSAFIKLGRRNALSISRLSIAAIVMRDGTGRMTAARIVPGAIFPVWRRVIEAERMLLGERPSRELFRAAGNKVSEVMFAETGRRWSAEYKEPVIAALVRRALEDCCR